MRKKSGKTGFAKYGNVLLATATAVSLLAGCAGGGKDAEEKNPAQDQGEAKKSPVKISIMANLHTPEVPSDLIEKLVEEKTNTQLDIQWVPDGSYEEKLNASFATGTLPQAVYMKNQSTLILFKDAIRDGQFWEIGPLLKDYPNLNNFNPAVMNNTSVDGKIYALYQERPLSRQGIIYRKDWADRLGLSAPKNVDELYDMLKGFTENDPNGSGKKDTIGLTDRSDLIYGAFKTISSYFGTPNNWSEEDGKLEPEFMHPGYMETMKYFRKLHEEGLINQDFPVTSKTDQQNLFITGAAGMYIGAMGDVVSLHQKMVEINPDIELEVHNRIEGPDGLGIWAIPGYGSAVLFPKSSVKTEEDLKDILSFYDQLMSPELANLIYYGVEGTHYNIVEGKASPVEDAKLTEREVKPYQAIMVGGPSTIDMLEGYFKLPVKAKAEELIIDNENFLIHDPTAPLDSQTYTERGVRLQEIIKDATYNFILGKLDEAGFQNEVDRWLKEGGSQIIEEFNESYQKAKSNG
ncbi:extracellular solute-binding protein [Paenibacillus sp. J2TS4]|uniref:extracellular solute-binding protein n=1 Tax=Paenibacillus sp. J2TS4 TaxID=2807194 RepID=UPI001B150E1C|nr:extracellular solute-binding protein [Paenibacillus sp. J2TS4]GIP35786.1 putative ABC transporter peptide-binding protein YtcQ [Paenibacillus sp. J2TS4]